MNEASQKIQAASQLQQRLTPKWSKYIHGIPTPKQHLGLCLDDVEEIFWGGAAGGGKSWWLMASALQYADCSDYAALLMRKNFPDLSQPGGLIDVSHEWLDGTDAVWNEQFKRWYFPSGAVIQFGHMDNKTEIKRYKGGEYQMIGIDELTDFQKSEAVFLHSRMRRRMSSSIPLRFRCASNPGGAGHMWVKERYVDSKPAKDRLFIPATLDDNPYLDRVSYLRALNRLDPITRERLLRGDWTVTEGGQIFDRAWFTKFLTACPVEVVSRVRAWDLAATVSETSKETAGVRMSRTTHGLWVIEDVIHGKWSPGERDRMILQTAWMDDEYTKVYLEEEPGSGGKAQNEALIRMLAGRRVESVRMTGDKFVRAGALASQVQAGNVTLVRGPWNSAFIEQLHAADPENEDILIDMMDAASLAFNSMVGISLNGMAVETPDDVQAILEDRKDEESYQEEMLRKRNRLSVYEMGDDKTWEGALN